MGHSEWLSRMEKEKRCGWALNYLSQNGVTLATQQNYERSELQTDKQKLGATLRELEQANDYKRIQKLKDAVRQQRAKENRKKERRAIKRLDLSYSALQKLKQHARYARQTQARYVEEMLETEDTLRKEESQLLKNKRGKLRDMAALQSQRRDSLDKRQKTLEQKEESLRKLSQLAAPLDSFIDRILALDEGATTGVHLPELYGVEKLQRLKAILAELAAAEL